MDLKELIFSLASENGTPGDENNAAKKACEILKEYMPNATVDAFGNVIGSVGDDSMPHLLLDAHIDEIGMAVTYINDDGFLKVGKCGGIDTRLLLAQQVTVFGKEKIKGVFISTPPHLEKDNKKIPDLDELYIDIGLTKEDAEKIVSLGDRVLVDSYQVELLNNQISGKALDDRCGVASILYALELVKGKKLNKKVSVMFSGKEETGGQGATVGTFKINPDMAIAVDVAFGKSHSDDETKCGKLGKGPMIGYSPILDRQIFETLKKIACENEIPYQLEIMGRGTDTNADDIVNTREGVRTSVISIPLKHMHTPVEVINVEDVENVGKLIAEFILSE